MTTGQPEETGSTSRVPSVEKANIIEVSVRGKDAPEIDSITLEISERLFKIPGTKTVQIEGGVGTIDIVKSTDGTFEYIAPELEDFIAYIRGQMGLPVRLFRAPVDKKLSSPTEPSQP
jgi:hypothetical protein